MSTFEQTLREQLNNAEHQLDDSVTLQLANVRRRALSTRRGFRLPKLMVPALGMVTASIVALVLVVAPLDSTGPGNGSADRLSPENTAFYEDLDFFYWLAESDAAKRS